MANSSCVAAATTASSPSVSQLKTLRASSRSPQILRFLPLTPSFPKSSKNNQKLVSTLCSSKAVYSNGFMAPDRAHRKGLWSIREDLELPSSPYLPVEAQGSQAPPPMVQERFQSVISQLFQHRIIRCGGEVEDDMANIIVAQLLYLDAIDPTKDIVMYVNSPGGSVTAGMAIFDTMRHIRPDVSTVCVGLAASMGAFLLSSGTKGKRYSLPNSRIMIHQPLGGAQGGQTDIDILANEMLHHKANLNGYLIIFNFCSIRDSDENSSRTPWNMYLSLGIGCTILQKHGCVFQRCSYDVTQVFLMLLVCPFNIFYRSSRYHFLKVIRNIVLALLYKVPMLRSLEYVACYYIASSYKTQDYGFCSRTPNYRDLSFAVSFVP